MSQVIIPATINPYPKIHEITAADLLARHFGQDVTFIARAAYRTPDFLIGSAIWELKSPTGSGKRTIQRNLQEAIGQSGYIVFDGRRMKMHGLRLRQKLRAQMRTMRKIERLLLITKSGAIVEIER